MEMEDHFTLHMDGKHKLHHGVWVLITLGTHCLRVVGETMACQLGTTFVPLVYLFCKNNESTGACSMLSNAANIVAQRCFGKKLRPGALVSDHSAGCRAGMLAEWEAPHGQCWPHIRRKLGEGAFCSKKHPYLNELAKHFDAIHLAQSDNMRDLLMDEVGKVWDSWPTKWNMKTFWNEYCRAPWDNWSVGCFNCMLCTPSQQTQEAWHKQILRSKIPGMFKGSTEQVMQVSLPKLIRIDGVQAPDKLLFHLPRVPLDMLKKAHWYASRAETHIHVTRDGDDDHPIYTFYILSGTHAAGSKKKKIDEQLVSRFTSIMKGDMPRGVNNLTKLIDIASSLHFVQFADDATSRRCVECEFNNAELVCSCKSCRHVGICSHILAVNHILGTLDLENLLGTMSAEKRKRGGFNKGVRPGLVREAALVRKKRKKSSSPSTPSAASASVAPAASAPAASVPAAVAPAASAPAAVAPAVSARAAAAYLPPTPPPPPDTSQCRTRMDALQKLLQEKRDRLAEEASIRERVWREMSVTMDTGIRVNRGLQEGFQGDCHRDHT